jgi:hypothetical protein
MKVLIPVLTQEVSLVLGSIKNDIAFLHEIANSFQHSKKQKKKKGAAQYSTAFSVIT